MALAVKQHGVWLTPNDPVSAKLRVWIGAAGSTSLIAALNQASTNQQAHESAHFTVLPALDVGVEESLTLTLFCNHLCAPLPQCAK